MIDHFGLKVADYAKAKAFYTAALAPLGVKLMREYPGAAGFGTERAYFFWLSPGGQTVPPVHLAFTAASRAEVDAFYHAAIAAGAKDNGGPGLRPLYHENYYGAFVLDPEGHNIEAVTHRSG